MYTPLGLVGHGRIKHPVEAMSSEDSSGLDGAKRQSSQAFREK